MKKRILTLMFAVVMSGMLVACGGKSESDKKEAEKPAVEEIENTQAQNSGNEAVTTTSVSDDPLCAFWINGGFDSFGAKDISSVELFPGMLTYGDIASATDIISKSTHVQINNYASNVIFESDDPNEVLNYVDDLGGSLSDDPDKIYLQAGGKQEIICKFGDAGSVTLLVCNNTNEKLTLKDAIAENDFRFESNAKSWNSDGTTDEIMNSFAQSLGAPDRIMIKPDDIEKLSVPSQSSYNAVSCYLCYKVGDMNIYFKYYEQLKGKDTVISSLNLIIEEAFTEGLLVNGNDYFTKYYSDYVEY